jgi:hypothetical protein
MPKEEVEDARRWLNKLIQIYDRTKSVINEIVELDMDSDARDWNRVFSNENVLVLTQAIEPIKDLPKPKQKKLRKLKQDYIDLLQCCLKAGHLYLKAYYNGHLSRLNYSKLIYWTSLAGGILKTFKKELYKVNQATKESIEWSCDECGATIQKDDNFCPKCGVEFEEE